MNPDSTARRVRMAAGRRGAVPLLVFVALALVGSGCGSDDDGAPSEPGSVRFYETPGAKDSGEPGEIIAQEPITLDGLDGEGRRVTYASTTPRGDIVHVTGVLIVPAGADAAGGLPVAVWGHPTVGVGTQCAPSLEQPFGLDGAQLLLDAGFIVAAPDYDGLGSEGTHPYLVGESEGRSMLDIARAAGAEGGGGVVVTWGHSQGGHAALWARSIAADYAPDLDLRATAAAAPPTDLSAFLDAGFTDPLILPITAQTAVAWGDVHENADLSPLGTDAAVEGAAEALTTCIVDLAAVTGGVEPNEIWAAGPDDVANWGELTAANSVDSGLGGGAVFLSHGAADTVVPIAGTMALAEALCAKGDPVAYRTDASWTHGTSYTESRDEMLAWMIAAVESEPASEC